MTKFNHITPSRAVDYKHQLELYYKGLICYYNSPELNYALTKRKMILEEIREISTRLNRINDSTTINTANTRNN
jgi:hypothetical protein